MSLNNFKPIIKFNGGRGAILCIQCSTILKEDLTSEELQGKTNLLYCDQCHPVTNVSMVLLLKNVIGASLPPTVNVVGSG